MLKLAQINSFFETNEVMVLDGGLASELEKQGYDLRHELWSARLLMEDPDAIRKVHRSYLEAGSTCITTASYQASAPGFAAAGIDEATARKLLMDSVSIARQAVAEFVSESCQVKAVDRPLVAASIGPYGAYLADGSEYCGDYQISRDELRKFHADRMRVICQANPDVLACETIPSRQEADVLKDLLTESSDRLAWVSFSCVDGEHISDGTRLQGCAEMFGDCDQVFAIGVNCTAPQYIESLIEQIRAGVAGKQVIVYPNSGQSYDAVRKEWQGLSNATDFGNLAKKWRAAGATMIGGCCQTGPDHIRAIQASLGFAN